MAYYDNQHPQQQQQPQYQQGYAQPQQHGGYGAPPQYSGQQHYPPAHNNGYPPPNGGGYGGGQQQQQQQFSPPQHNSGGYGGYPQQQQQQPSGGYRRPDEHEIEPYGGGGHPQGRPPPPPQQQHYGGGQGGGGNHNVHRPHQHQPGDNFWYKAPQGGRGEVKQRSGANEWQTSLLAACCNEPIICLMGYACPWCCVMQQRRKLLFGDMEQYECCAGMWGQSCTKNCNSCTRGNESICLCLESFLCLGCAVHGNRYMIMKHYNLQNDCCDVFIMWLACICSVVACLLGDENLESLADLIYYIVIGCMLAQHEHQMKCQGYPRNSLQMR